MSGDLASSKAELRSHFRAARRALGPEQRTTETIATVTTLCRFLAARPVVALASYAAMGSELDLAEPHRWWWSRGQSVWLPRQLPSHALAWHPLTAEAALRPGPHGVLEPDPVHIPAAQLPAGAVLLVPGLAFTAQGQRLGQGAGYYDRLLAGGGCLSIGIGFACQRAAALPVEAHDRSVDLVLLGGAFQDDASDSDRHAGA